MMTNARRSRSPQHSQTKPQPKGRNMSEIQSVPVQTKGPLPVPIWHHTHSNKIRVGEIRPRSVGNCLYLRSNAVLIKIYQDPDGAELVLEYSITHFKTKNPPDSYSKGSVRMSFAELANAFGLGYVCDPASGGQEILNRYGGDVAVQGKYIRFDKFLNIPGPGTGNDGDPNVSIYIDAEIGNAIFVLLDDIME